MIDPRRDGGRCGTRKDQHRTAVNILTLGRTEATPIALIF
jgi:hypothetical protein